MKKQFTILLILIFILGLFPADFSDAANIATRLKGKILLQVESKGEAWYVNPDNEKRYYLGRPADAFQVMRELGLGISNKDFNSFNGYAPSRLSGKILLKVEDIGKAYYINPVDLKMHYLGRPADAFQVMRTQGLGITNQDIEKISTAFNKTEESKTTSDIAQNKNSFITEEDKENLQLLLNSIPKVTKNLIAKDLSGNYHTISIDIPIDYYLYYKNKPHYMGDNYKDITAFITPDDYFINLILEQVNDYNNKMLEQGKGMQTILDVNENIVQQTYYTEDWHSGYNEYPKYPIETIFEGNGDCEDTSFLLATLYQTGINKMKKTMEDPLYEIALLRFPTHVAVGWHANKGVFDTEEESFNFYKSQQPQTNGWFTFSDKKYFYIETTNPQFKFGEIPDELSNQSAILHKID